ncbi:hypothetical protein BC833DRAFT_591698 [Globomyces pollinis-pini]|nr:hypothetical protein BC833DRAFT_591698 [Globomyces pollinis-pini]
MGNQVSVEKSINSVKQNSEKSITHRGVLLEAKWIPEDAALLKLDSLQLIRMSLEVVPSVIFRVETLTRLNLSGNKLVSITKIGSLKSLEYLDVACNCLDYLPDDLCLLENLKELLINGNQLTARSLPYNFEALKSLKVLDISNNKLATLETNVALFWQTISVTLYGNPWENATLLKINQSMTDEEVQNILGKYLEGQSGGIEESVKSHVKNPSNITKPTRQKIEATPVAIKNSPAKSRFESDLESTLKQKVPLKTSNEEASNITKPVANTSPIETSPTKDEPNSDNTSVDVLERSGAPLKTAVRASGPRGRKGPSPEFIAKNASM